MYLPDSRCYFDGHNRHNLWWSNSSPRWSFVRYSPLPLWSWALSQRSAIFSVNPPPHWADLKGCLSPCGAALASWRGRAVAVAPPTWATPRPAGRSSRTPRPAGSRSTKWPPEALTDMRSRLQVFFFKDNPTPPFPPSPTTCNYLIPLLVLIDDLNVLLRALLHYRKNTMQLSKETDPLTFSWPYHISF